jgi:pimeloyl-ACP methyl ester carboxylesterase
VREPASRVLDASGLRLHYLDWGHVGRDVVVFLHGGGLDAHAWDRTCAALGDDYHCYALDLRGHGDSGWSPPQDYSLAAHVGDVLDFARHIGSTPVSFVGHSLGGFVAIALAAGYPEQAASLIAVDATPFARGGKELARIKAFALDQREFDSVDDAVTYAAKHYPDRDHDSLRRSLERRLEAMPDGRWTWKHAHRISGPDYFEKLVADVRTLIARASSIQCPALVVRGSHSEAVDHDEAMAFLSLLPLGELAQVEGAGHNVHRDNPDALAAALHTFLATARSRRLTTHSAQPRSSARSR